MKRIITIENLFERAMKMAKRKEDNLGYAYTNRFGHAVYAVIVDLNSMQITLKHYGTVTILYDLKNEELLSWYGESVSDRDSMNTFLNCLGEDKYYFRYGPKMGFIMEEGGVKHEVNPRASEVSVSMHDM